MDRKAKIFAPTKSVGGIRKPVKPTTEKTASNSIEIKKILDSIKTNVTKTQLTSCSYKLGNDIINIENPSIQSLNKGGKNICLLVNGNINVVDQETTMKNLPEGLENLMEKFAEEEKVNE